ncbi:MAG: hypothetical protein K2J30_05075, partial [Clostridia bacterium]|nr:hypothetical protein [Clostridia bacterium]
TVGAFTQKILQAFAAGEVYVDYGMRNVSIGKALVAGLGENFVELGDIPSIGQLKGNAAGTSVVSMPSATNGLAVTFRISGANSEWGSFVLQSGAYIITTSNLDAWGASGNLAQTNKGPTRFQNGGSVQAFLNRECYITVSVSAEGVVYYRDGVRVITHGKDEYMNYNNAGASTTVKVSDFVTAFLA